MRRKNSSKKALLFLFSLILFGYFANVISSKGIPAIKLVEEARNQPAFSTDTSCQGGIEEVIVPENSNYKVHMIDRGQTIDITNQYGEVQGLVSCDEFNPANILQSVRRLCPTSSADVNQKKRLGSKEVGGGGGGINVEKISKFELIHVTYPLAFWLGKYTMANSNRQISMIDPAYSSNGEQIDEDYQLKTLSPQQSDSAKGAVSGTVRKEFAVKGKLTLNADRVDQNEDGEYVVKNADHDPKCGCPVDVSASDYNVGKSNYLGSRAGGYYRQQIPQGDNYDNNIGSQCLDEGKDFDMSPGGNVTACIDLVSVFVGLFQKVFSPSQWSDCNGETEVCTTDTNGVETCETKPETNCIDPRSIAVQMTPIFGDPYECTDELCANAFLTYAYKGTLTPEQAAGKKVASNDNNESLMFFIGTDCQARIDIAGGGSEVIDVVCLWDASPILFNYKLQAKDKAPKQEDFPQLYETYWNQVKNDIPNSAIKYGL